MPDKGGEKDWLNLVDYRYREWSMREFLCTHGFFTMDA
jgi:hypothetical protein